MRRRLATVSWWNMAEALDLHETLERAERALDDEDHALAAGLCTQVLETDPAHPRAALVMVRLCLERGREDAAEASLNRTDQTQLRAYLDELARARELPPAVAHAGAFAADHADWLELGLALAAIAVSGACTVAPRVVRARLERKLGDFTASHATLVGCAELGPHHCGLQREVARWFAAAGYPQDALERYEGLLRYFPGDAVARLERWQLRHELGLNRVYESEAGSDEYLHQTFFADQHVGLVVEAMAERGAPHSNTLFFERELRWVRLELDPSSPKFSLRSAISQLKNRAVDYCAIHGKDAGPLVGAATERELSIRVWTITQPDSALKQLLTRARYTYDVTLGRDEVWYDARSAKKKHRPQLEARA